MVVSLDIFLIKPWRTLRKGRVEIMTTVANTLPKRKGNNFCCSIMEVYTDAAYTADWENIHFPSLLYIHLFIVIKCKGGIHK